jgi:hypothetical protein
MLRGRLRRICQILLATVCWALACGDQRAPLVGNWDSPPLHGVVVLAQTSLPELTSDPLCSGEPALILGSVSFGAAFGFSPPTDNTSCPDGSVCCLSASDFTYGVTGQTTADGPIALSVSTGGVEETDLTTQLVLLPTDGAYPPPGTPLDPGPGRTVAFPPMSDSYTATQATFDDTGANPWTTGQLPFPDLPWSAQICGEYVAAPPLRRAAWAHSWDASTSKFDRVLLSMRYADADQREVGYVLCSTPADAGTLTVPEQIMRSLPALGAVYPVLIGERDVLLPLGSGSGSVRVVLQNQGRLSALPLGD